MSTEEFKAWMKKHRIIAEMDKEGYSKRSREDLHDTSHAVSTLSELEQREKLWALS